MAWDGLRHWLKAKCTTQSVKKKKRCVWGGRDIYYMHIQTTQTEGQQETTNICWLWSWEHE